MLRTARPDGGCLRNLHEKPNKRLPKSCARGSAKALPAFSELPEYRDHARCRQLLDYFLNRHGIFKSRDHTRLVNDDMRRSSFPITWRTNAWEILCALSRMGYGRDERLENARSVMEGRRDTQGRYPLDMTPA